MTLPIQTLSSPNFTIGSEEVNATSYKQALQNLLEHIDNMLNPFSAKDVLDKFDKVSKHGIEYKKFFDYFESLSLSESTKSFIKELGVAIENNLKNCNRQILDKITTQIRNDLTRLSEHSLEDIDMCPELKRLLSQPEVKRLENSDINEIINCININNEDILKPNLAIALEKNSVNELEKKLVNELEERLKNLLGSDVVRDNINPQLKEAGFSDLHTLISNRMHQYLKRNVASTLEKTLTLSYVIKKIQGQKTLEFRFITITKEGSPDIEKQKCIIKCLSWIFDDQQKKPVSIILTNCVALTDKKVKSFWHNNLKYLDFRYSSVNEEIVEKISHQCKNLKKLYLSKCDQLKAVAAKCFDPEDPLNFPNLKVLHVARCAKLTKVNIDAPNLRSLKANNNAKLEEVSLSLLPLVKLNIDNCPLLEDISLPLNPIVEDEVSTFIPPIAFGKYDWGKYFGDIGEELPLPSNIEEILDKPCSFWPDKKVKDTHLLVLIPNEVNGKPFTMNYLGEIIQKPKAGLPTKYRSYNDCLKKTVGDKSYPSHWVLMTRDAIPASRNESYSKCCELIANHSKKTGIPYELPRLLDATASIFVNYVKRGEMLYSYSPWATTYSQDVADNNQWVVGGYWSGGLQVFLERDCDLGLGAAGCWRF